MTQVELCQALNELCKKVAELEERLEKVEHSSSEKKDANDEQSSFNYCEKDVEVTLEALKWYHRNKKDSTFSQFDSGERAIVFGDADYLEQHYLEFWREFCEWHKEKYSGMGLKYSRETLKPFFKQPSIYDDRKPFAIWLCIGKGGPWFQYETLPSNWSALNTIKGLPYTVWGV